MIDFNFDDKNYYVAKPVFVVNKNKKSLKLHRILMNINQLKFCHCTSSLNTNLLPKARSTLEARNACGFARSRSRFAPFNIRCRLHGANRGVNSQQEPRASAKRAIDVYKYIKIVSCQLLKIFFVRAVPSPPVHLTVRQLIGRHISLLWDRPQQPRGVIRYYTLYHAPPLPPRQKVIAADGLKTMSVDVEGFYIPNNNYSFWVSFAVLLYL